MGASPLGHCATAVVVLLAATTVAVTAAARTKYDCHSGDKAALRAIQAAFGNSSYFQGWTPEFPCCRWFGVLCNINHSVPYTPSRVISVAFLRDDSLVGPLPGAALARLTALQELSLIHVPGVNGTIPRDLVRLSGTLSFLEISYTGMSGALPPFLSQLTALTYLRVNYNPRMAGPIPVSLADLPGLSFLDLRYNGLTGTIPPLLLSKTPGDDVILYLAHNNLTGGVPAGFAAVGFADLDLSHNGLAGDPAAALFGNRTVQNLGLARNAFSFNLSAVQLPPQLHTLDISHNDVYGELPPQVANLWGLNVSYNRLSGAVPTGGFMDRFDQYCFLHNKGLCGAPLPPCN